jgi:hypothetical protein
LARDWSYKASHNVRGRQGQRRPPAALRAPHSPAVRHADRFFLLRMLVIIGVIVGPAATAAMAASEETPRPPCKGVEPLPAYASPGALPAPGSGAAAKQTRRGPLQRAPAGLRRAHALAALAVHFSHGGSSDALLSRFGAISTLKGLQYWSVTEGGWRTLITQATALLPTAQLRACRDAERQGAVFRAKDNRAAGDVIYRMQVREMSPTRLVVAIEKCVPDEAIHADAVQCRRPQSLDFLERLGPNV